jgi:glycogen synthase
VPNDDVDLRFRARDARSLAELMTLVLSNPAVRFRLVTEASAHVRRFDWSDVAQRTAAVHAEVAAAAAQPQTRSTILPRT